MNAKFLAVCAVLALATSAISAQVYINEYCADPFLNTGAVGIDANGDGVVATSASQSNDEFVEIVNAGATTVNMSGWQLWDQVLVRHTFANGTLIPPGGAIIVFGGGSVANFNTVGAGLGVLATSGSIALNNNGDVISLIDPNTMTTVDTYTYLPTPSIDYGDGQSVVRNPETPGSPFVQIMTVTPTISHSAGYMNDGVTPYLPATLPTATYPGNFSDIAIAVSFDGVPDPQLTRVHTVPLTATYVTFNMSSPTGSLVGTPFILATVLFATGTPPVPITLPGDVTPALWLSPLSSVTLLLDGFTTLGAPFSPVIGPGTTGYAAVGAIPAGLSGLGLSFMVQLIAADPGINLANLGLSDAHELIF